MPNLARGKGAAVRQGNAGDLTAKGFRPVLDVMVTIDTSKTDENQFCLKAVHTQPIPDIYFDSDKGTTRTAPCISN